MAESSAHRFGQVIGNLLEEILLPVLQEFAERRGLFLDRHGKREGVRKGSKLSWKDHFGNSHDLDFVIEKDATATQQGRPVAFIEAAWRRYTKHSKNKAQEIQGAILPIAEAYKRDKPFLGAVLAGEFTQPSLDQLASNGFNLVHIPYGTVVAAFSEANINVRFDEQTPDREFAQCVDEIEALPDHERKRIKTKLRELNAAEFDRFFSALARKLDRLVERVIVLPLFGTPSPFTSVKDARGFIENFDPSAKPTNFQKYEVIVSFANGDKIDGTFSNKADALSFLDYVAS